jgi:glycerol kinase
VLLPSRRACLALRDTFLELSDGRPLLLPRLQPVGDIDADELLLDPATLAVLATAARPVAIAAPRPGWVEQDAAEVWESLRAAAADALAQVPDASPVAIAISNQRESAVAWDGTGTPLAPLISWQDQRGVPFLEPISTAANQQMVRARTGLELTAMYSAAKLRWLVDQSGGRGDARFGTVDSWLVDRLTGGRTYAIEAGNASRTLLFDITTLGWDPELCALFEVPLE